MARRPGFGINCGVQKITDTQSMKKLAVLLLALLLVAPAQADDNPHVWLDTDFGPIIIELYPDKAPVTVENFLTYVNEGFYDGLVFHRVARDGIVQAGLFDIDRKPREITRDPISNEASNGLLNEARSVAMALRSPGDDSATTQFFINLRHNESFDGDYAVFGKVIRGMTVVKKINRLETINFYTLAPHPADQRLQMLLHESPHYLTTIKRAVQTADKSPIMPDHSGSWYDPDNAGVGFNMEIGEDAGGNGPLITVYWYNFDTESQFWLTGTESFDYGDSEVKVNLISHSGQEEGVDFQQPPESDFEDYGSITISFRDCNRGVSATTCPATARAASEPSGCRAPPATPAADPVAPRRFFLARESKSPDRS